MALHIFSTHESDLEVFIVSAFRKTHIILNIVMKGIRNRREIIVAPIQHGCLFSVLFVRFEFCRLGNKMDQGFK